MSGKLTARISAEYLEYIESKICVKKFANVYLTVTAIYLCMKFDRL